MKIVIAGGSGQVGSFLQQSFAEKGNEVIILGRKNLPGPGYCQWDGKTLGPWTKEIEGADVVINLAGRSVNCRYSDQNLHDMMNSRVDSARVMGEAISKSVNPPKIWMQMSTATIYAHTFGPAHDEERGLIGGHEPEVPAYWKFSIDIATAWEKELFEADTPKTRKIAMRSAMVMTPKPDGIFDVLVKLVRRGLGGTIGSGSQFVSWIHGRDFFRAIEFVINDEKIDGIVNFASPNPLPQREFMSILRKSFGIPIGLPATKWMAEIGAFFMRTDTELILKSRRVVPGRLMKLGFKFDYPTWSEAAKNLAGACSGLREDARANI